MHASIFSIVLLNNNALQESWEDLKDFQATHATHIAESWHALTTV